MPKSTSLATTWLHSSLGKIMNDHPQAYNGEGLRKFYADLVLDHGWMHVLPLVDSLDALLLIRDALRLFSFTSHETLVFSRHPEYPGWADDDVVRITPLQSGQVEVAYVGGRSPRGDESRVVSYAELILTVDSFLRQLVI
jgi:hypothetical protein